MLDGIPHHIFLGYITLRLESLLRVWWFVCEDSSLVIDDIERIESEYRVSLLTGFDFGFRSKKLSMSKFISELIG